MSRVALVTGSSRGLRYAIAQRLSADGMTIAFNGLDLAETEQSAASIRTAGGQAAPFDADVTDEAGAAGLVASIVYTLGPIEVLVINATGPQPRRVLAALCSLLPVHVRYT